MVDCSPELPDQARCSQTSTSEMSQKWLDDDRWSQMQGYDRDRGRKKETPYCSRQVTVCCWLLKNFLNHVKHTGGTIKTRRKLQVHQSLFYHSNVCIGNQGKSLEWSRSHYSRSLWLTSILYYFGKKCLKVKPEGLHDTKPILIGHGAKAQDTKYGKWGSWCHIVYLWFPHGPRTAWRYHGLTWSF